MSNIESRSMVRVLAGHVELEGELHPPSATPGGIVVFAHGSGSSRQSPRNTQVAAALEREGLGTLLFDLLSDEEEQLDNITMELRFDIPLLARRVTAVLDWVRAQPKLREHRIGLFGASTGAAAALVAAAHRPEAVAAVVSRGGRPDLAGDALELVRAPTLLIVGSRDEQVLTLNEHARAKMVAPVRIEVVEGATHLFEEPGTLGEVAAQAARFFRTHLIRPELRARP
jgi:dienelactone hydrolase